MSAIRFSLNHMISPSMSMQALLAAASALDVSAVELRNDVGDNSLSALQSAKAIGAEARDRGITILSINALYPFNIWNDERRDQAEQLADLAAACGATGLVMCPLNENRYVEDSDEKTAMLQEALSEMATILAARELKGFVEPLGFPVSSLRLKAEALAAIDAIDRAAVFSLVHDTFHHKGAGEPALYAERTGLVHCSGLVDPDITFTDMLDGHRVLVDDGDRLDNIGQLKTLLRDGYSGVISFEPFARSVWDLRDPVAAVKTSMDYIREQLSTDI